MMALVGLSIGIVLGLLVVRLLDWHELRVSRRVLPVPTAKVVRR